ncbi:MAG: hypothetical protein RIC35_09945 [Marinoscillum sp.]
MSILIPIRKQVLRLLLGIMTLLIPIALPLGLLVRGSDQIFLTSVNSYLYTEIRILFILILVLFSLVFIVYGLVYRKGRMELFTSGFLVLFIAFFPDSYTDSWAGHLHTVAFIGLLGLLGWLIRHTFNLPLGFPVLTKVGTLILILDLILLIWVLAFNSLWPLMVFLLETVMLWLFTVGILVRHKINKKLGG